MECIYCTQGVKTSEWFANLCTHHRSEYMRDKHAKNVEKLRNIFQKTKTKNIICVEYGHSFQQFDKLRDSCRRCGLIISARELQSIKAKEYHQNRISQSLSSERYLTKLHRFYTSAPKIWDTNSPASKVANMLYYLRYNLRWSSEKICKEINMPLSTLNAYIMYFSAVVRNGKIVVLPD